MLVQLRTHGLDLTAAIRRHLEQRVRTSLRSSGTSVRAVTVSLSDVNGPRGGVDLHCAVNLELMPRGSVRAEATDSDLLAAVRRALARVHRGIERAAGRHRRGKPGRSVPTVLVDTPKWPD
jgi:putative sigma-54 modulation protein